MKLKGAAAFAQRRPDAQAKGSWRGNTFVSRYLVALSRSEDLHRLIETDCAAWEQHHPSTEN